MKGTETFVCEWETRPSSAYDQRRRPKGRFPYLLAIAALDSDVQLAQLDPKRIEKPDVQELLLKVEVRPDSRFAALYPDQLASRVTVRLKSGESFSHEVSDYPGSANQPFTWKEVEAKFDKLATSHAGEKLCQEIKRAVRSLENIQVSDLMNLLGQVN